MTDLMDDDDILGPVTYFKYPSTSEYEHENGFDLQKVKQDPGMFDNPCPEYGHSVEYGHSPYFFPQNSQQHSYNNEVCQSAAYNQTPNMYQPYKPELKPETLNYGRNEHEQRHSPMLFHHNIPTPPQTQHNSYQQNPFPNDDYWHNSGWLSPYMGNNNPQNYPHHPSHCYQEAPVQQTSPQFIPNMNDSAMKKRGRKKKIKSEYDDSNVQSNNFPSSIDIAQLLSSTEQQQQQQQQHVHHQQSNDPNKVIVKERRKHDRFNGMPEEEVSKRTLPDLLATNLDIVIIGINPGLFAAYKGHHYAGPGNHFWKCLYMSGLTSEPLTADDDYKLLQNGIGFTNMVERATKGSSDLTRKEIRDGGQVLLEKLQKFKPKIAVFNGKLIFEVFSGKKEFNFGRQPDFVDGTDTYMWVMPSSSARCAQLPRASDKVPYYAALKKFRDYLNGMIPTLDESDLVFQYCKLKTYPKMIKDESSTPPISALDIKEECFNDEFDEEDSLNNCSSPMKSGECYSAAEQSPNTMMAANRQQSQLQLQLQLQLQQPVKKKSKCDASPEINPDNGGVIKKKRGRPKKIRPELTPAPAGGGLGVAVSSSSGASTSVSSVPTATAVIDNSNSSPSPSCTSKYFQSETSSPNCCTPPEDISPPYQNQFSSPSDVGDYYSQQNSIESAFSTFDFHPSEIQSHLRSFLPSSKHESPLFLNE